ncbi:MAG: transglutaminase domain-containing protein [Clostridiales bacterium]|nr:transglutaminase domain-containing protein [Clostridiales bacterium]
MNKNQTAKKSKSVYIIGSITLGIIALLAVYLILIATGVISASPVHIVVATSSETMDYDGTALTCDEWSIESGKLKDGHSLRVTVTGSQTEVGSSKNTAVAFVVDAKGNDVSGDYKISFKFGTLDVMPRKVVLQSASAEKDYDGTPLTASSCAIVGGTLIFGHEITYYINGTLTSSGKADNTFTATVSDGERDVTHNYSFEYLFGTLYVHGEKLEIHTHSDSKTYDGTPLTCDKWTLASGVIHDGDTLYVTVTGIQTEVGTSDNYASCRVLNDRGEEVTASYEAVFTYGTLTVEPIVIVLETRPAYKIYDGTPLVSDCWRVVTDDTLATDAWLSSGQSFTVGEYTVTATVIGRQTAVGVSDNTAVYVRVTQNGGEAEGIEVKYKLGALTVAPRNLTVQSGSASKEFDGKPLTCDEYDVVSITQVAQGQRLLVAISGTITYVGSVPNTIAEVIVMQGAEDVTRNYNIKLQEGRLVVYGDDGTQGGGGGGGEGEGGEGDGGNEGEGGKGGNLDDSGSLGGGDNDGAESDPKLVLRLRADRDGEIYLRYMSFGDYNMRGWDDIAAYNETIEVAGVRYGMNYLMGAALASAGVEYGSVEIELVGSSQYYLPYYLSMTELDSVVQTSDVKYVGSGTEYAVYFYSYNYIADGGRKLMNIDLGALSRDEQAYRDYVHINYTAVPDSTRLFLQGIIDEQGFAAMDLQTLIASVAAYVRGAATYNLKYDTAMDFEDDVVKAFLSEYKEGVCRHYASAATLLFRTLGIPARYCIGYAGNTKSGEWVDVTTKEAHAWTEVYIDGAGWVQLEVTGGGAGFDGTGGSGNTGIGNPNSDRILSIKPFDVYLNYSDYKGVPLTYELDSLQGLSLVESLGYRYEFTVSGSQNEVGIGESRIMSFKLIDNFGNDVTDDYNIILSSGKLHIYIQEITVKTESLTSVYNGTYLRSISGGWECVGTLLEGHSISSVTMTGSRLNVGRSLNTFDIIIIDESGKDVTYMYKVNADCGYLTVSPREITVTAGSATGYLNELNGAALVCGEYTITSDEEGGALGQGDSAIVVISGSQSLVGRSANSVDSVTIRSADGKDVTANYIIHYVSGSLTVLPQRPLSGVEEDA